MAQEQQEMNQKQDSQESKTLNDEMSAEEFEEDNSFENNENEKEKVKKEGMSALQTTEMIAKMSSMYIPKEHKQEYIQEYIEKTYPIMEMVNFEELTEGMSLKEMPEWLRWSIVAGAIGINTWNGVKKYKGSGKNE